jgi:hypothetical protein
MLLARLLLSFAAVRPIVMPRPIVVVVVVVVVDVCCSNSVHKSSDVSSSKEQR